MDSSFWVLGGLHDELSVNKGQPSEKKQRIFIQSLLEQGSQLPSLGLWQRLRIREQSGKPSLWGMGRPHAQGEAAVSGPGAGRPLYFSGVYIWLSFVGLKLGMETNVEALINIAILGQLLQGLFKVLSWLLDTTDRLPTSLMYKG